jgi:hypothetical protein
MKSRLADAVKEEDQSGKPNLINWQVPSGPVRAENQPKTLRASLQLSCLRRFS